VEPLRGWEGGGGIFGSSNNSSGSFQFIKWGKLLHRFRGTTVMSMKLRGNGSVFLFAFNTEMTSKGIPNRSRI